MDSERMLSPNMEEVGPKNAARIWGFVSKFVMLDRFAKTLFGTDFHPGFLVPRKQCKEDYLGSGAKVSVCFFPFCWSFLTPNIKLLEDLMPPTKLLGKFLKTWSDRQRTRAQLSETVVFSPSSVNGRDQADIVLTISRRLMDVVKAKNVLHIEAGMEMMALALSISSEVCNIGLFKAV